MDNFRIEFDTSELNSKLDKLVDGAKSNTRPAAQAAAQVFYGEAKLRVPVSRKGHWFYGTSFKINGKKYYFESATLKNSLYQVYSNDNSGDDKATYHIAWNHKKAPYGFMVEYGTSRAPAHPFLRPSFDARVEDAIEAAKRRYAQDMYKVIGEL